MLALSMYCNFTFFCKLCSCFLRRGALIIRRLCVLLDAERVYRELSTILEGEADLDFACTMVQVVLNFKTSKAVV